MLVNSENHFRVKGILKYINKNLTMIIFNTLFLIINKNFANPYTKHKIFAET
jgi:hypothetical protein